MADQSAARTANLDQRYAQMKAGVDGLVEGSRCLLDELGPEEAAVHLTKGILHNGYPNNVLASYLAVAIVRLQQQKEEG